MNGGDMSGLRPDEWKVPVTWFALFNLLVVPVGGRVLWYLMLSWNTADLRLMSVALSILGAAAILGVNTTLTLWARRVGLARGGLTAMWLITGATFLITIGFGVFSPINLILGLLRYGAGG